MFKFASIGVIGSKAWDDIVWESPDGWPFALTAWQRVILGVEEWRLSDHSFGVIDGTDLVAAIPLQFDGRNRVLSSTGWGGCGPVFARHLAQPDRRRVIRALQEHIALIARSFDAKAFNFSIPPATETMRSAIGDWSAEAYSNCGVRVRRERAQIIDLASDERALWSAVASNARRTINKARDYGVTVALESWAQCIGDYYRIHQETYARTGVAPHPYRYFAGIAEELAPIGCSVLWVARNRQGEAVAFHNDMHFQRGAWYHTGCSTAEAMKLGANYLLFWEALRGAKLAGRLWYDCGDIFPESDDPKQRGLTVFKTRFGGVARPSLKFERIYAEGPASKRGAKLALKAIARRLKRAVLRGSR